MILWLVAGDTELKITSEDIEYLKHWLNPAYLDEGGWAKIQRRFEADGSLQLYDFLLPKTADRVIDALLNDDDAVGIGNGKMPSYDVGIDGEWLLTGDNNDPVCSYQGFTMFQSSITHDIPFVTPVIAMLNTITLQMDYSVGPPHKQRYLEYTGTKLDDNAKYTHFLNVSGHRIGGDLLSIIRHLLFGSEAFARFLKRITTITMLGHSSNIRRFRPGELLRPSHDFSFHPSSF